MFRNRASEQKPADDFYANFRQSFPEVGAGTAPPIHGRSASISAGLSDGTSSLRGGNMIPEQEEVKDHDPTPRGVHEPWRFTPSLLDPNSFAFTSFANQPPGYYTPTPGGTNTLYHSQAGDLHTPSMGIGVGTPLSLPTTESGVHVGSTVDLHGFTHPPLPSTHFQTFNPFAAQTSFAPSHFQTDPTATYESMDATGAVSPTGGAPGAPDTEMQEQSPTMNFPSTFDTSTSAPIIPQATERFRFHVTLNAPTAMIKSTDEIPVTYLNKGQAYSISIVDSAPPPSHLEQTKYRTYIRISFEDEQQRQRPAACWQLWKEGRGINEAHQRGGKLQAVEYVEPNSTTEEENKTPAVEVESASFDGFAVRWTAAPGGTADCTVAVRFNFLSTDFSHSKGVKGIPVRLCAKTQVIPTLPSPLLEAPEVCFCKVKLFRDHGAERKLSNDVAHVKKTIDKLKQQIAQAESGMKDFGKRKRSTSTAVKIAASGRPGKVLKHKRTWSMSSASSSGGRAAAEEDLHLKLATMQDMFTSTRPVSVLFLRGEDPDDPDAHPVQLPSEPASLSRVNSGDGGIWDRRQSVTASQTTGPSAMVSPASSSSGHGFRAPTAMQSPRQTQAEWALFQAIPPAAVHSSNPQHLASPPDQPVKVPKVDSGDNDGLSGWIEALGVDSSYRPPPERPIKPVACFYILRTEGGGRSKERYYRAVYLMRRTTEELVNSIAVKLEIEPSRILRTVHLKKNGMEVLVDDDLVRELPEGQDMLVEVSEIKRETMPRKREWDSGPNDTQTDGDILPSLNLSLSELELKLGF
ncbi:MAG: hypothetical protein M1816_007219 [Peltula sp. TS41687]|nr:MAG: hypothetical protein M1816_007219 [Peltula sp. TS41687]